MAVLTAAQRKKIPTKLFGIPEKAPGSGSYPLADAAHARDALSRSAGKPVAARIRRKVRELYPGIKQGGKLRSLSTMAA